MRRMVEKENRDIDARIGKGGVGKLTQSSTNKSRRRKPINLCLVMLVLSPVAIVGALVYATRQYTIWSTAQHQQQAEGLTPQEKILKNSSKVASSSDKKMKRLRNAGQSGGKIGEEAIVDIDNNISPSEHVQGEAVAEQQIIMEQPAKTLYDRKILVLTTKHGNIKITLRPDLSSGSVDYIYKLVESYGGNGKRCMHCKFYRSEKPGILQGIMAHEGVVPVNEVLGTCPEGAESVKNDCPEWDKHCGCHGPVMTRGAIAWAAGQAGGPDFFVDAYRDPARFWGTQHTNFGFIDDEASLKIIDDIFELPIESTSDMDYLKDPIHFDLVLE